MSELGSYSSPFYFVMSLKNLESSLSSSFAVIVSGSLVSSIVEQNRFRALMSDFVFLTVLLDFCAEIKSSSFCSITVAFAFSHLNFKFKGTQVRDHSGQCPVQYLENIGPVIEHFDWLILVIGPLTA